MNPSKPFPLPVRVIGPGSQPDEDDTLDYMVMPQGMSTWQPPALPEREDLVRHTGAQAALRAALQALQRARQGLPTPPVDLGGLSGADRELLNQVLGEGEVSVRVQLDAGELLVQESVFAGVWRVVHSVDGRTLSDQIEVGRMPVGVLEAAARRVVPLSARRVRLVPPADASRTSVWPEGVMNAPAILDELEDHIAAWRPNQPAKVINLTLLPLSPIDLQVIDEILGTGPILILSRGYGNCRITLTRQPMTWQVSYFNSQDSLILHTIEVTDLPEVACAAREDLEDSHERLADLLEWVQGD